MKSFLEYVAQRLMGRPVSGSCWRCPFCDSRGPSFSVRPPKPGYPVKYKCFRCGEWGDEYDLLCEFYPEDDYARRRERVEQWRQKYERGAYSYRGAHSVNTAFPGQGIHDVNLRDVGLVWANLMDEFRKDGIGATFALQIVIQFADHAHHKNARTEALLSCWHAQEYQRVQDEIRHRCRHLPFFRWPEAAQDQFLLACAREEAQNMRILDRELEAVEAAIADLLKTLHDDETDEPFALRVLTRCESHCDPYGVSVEALLAYWNDFERWDSESDQRHLAECNDPDCDARICRAARGLPPLTKEEIEAERRERLLAKRQQDERIRRAMRSVPKSRKHRRS